VTSPLPPGSPWQNCFAERVIGSIGRECVDHVIALGEQHLRKILKSYENYYNLARTYHSLDKDAPVSRSVQRIGRIVSHVLVGCITNTPGFRFSARTSVRRRKK